MWRLDSSGEPHVETSGLMSQAGDQSLSCYFREMPKLLLLPFVHDCTQMTVPVVEQVIRN